jgi:hypothetical protein
MLYLHAARIIREMADQHKSAQKIQAINRGKTARKATSSLKEQRIEETRQADAALKMQALQRGRMGRYHVHGERQKRDDFAAVRLQAVQRRKLAKSRVDDMKKERDASIKMQAIQRGRMGRAESMRRKSSAEDMKAEEEASNKAATVLQSVQRRKTAVKITDQLKEDKSMGENAGKIQALQRARLQKKEFEEKRDAIAKLQAAERGRVGRKKANEQKVEYKSAVVLQSIKRGGDGRVAARQAARAQSMSQIGDGKIHVGDVVKARVAGEVLWCEGIVIGKSGDTTIEEFDVDFGDGEVQEHVPITSIRKIFNWDTLEIGDHVKAPVPDFAFMKADAEVVAYEGEVGGERLYTIKFDDGEVCEHVKASDMVKATSSRTKAVMLWRKGYQTVKAVSAFTDKKWGAYRRLSTAGGAMMPKAVDVTALPGFKGALAQRTGDA